jgi:hypothetical protein
VLPVAARARPGAPVGHGGLEGRPRLGLALGRPGHPEQLHTLWQDTVARSRSLVAEALADGGLERLARRTWPDGEAPSLRWTLVHLIEEYARHNGHADLLRESVDGLTGE